MASNRGVGVEVGNLDEEGLIGFTDWEWKGCSGCSKSRNQEISSFGI